eukprot:13281739-Alexandrium_andersonii.AAC.1
MRRRTCSTSGACASSRTPRRRTYARGRPPERGDEAPRPATSSSMRARGGSCTTSASGRASP